MKLILNNYIKRPLLWDIAICLIVAILFHFIKSKFNFSILISKEEYRSILTDILSTSISLAGFILASLTIIVTFKENISHKINAAKNNLQNTDPLSGIEILFESKHYSRIVRVFFWAAFIYLLIFLGCSILKLSANKIPDNYFFYIVLSAIILTSLTIFRSLLILYRVIKLQLKK